MISARACSTAALLACTAVAGDAASSGMPPYGALPVGDVGRVPSARLAPDRIGPDEKVPGFFVVRPSGAQSSPRLAGSKRPEWVFLFGSAEDAKLAAGQRAFGGGPPDGSVCFTTADRAQMFARAAAVGQGEEADAEPTPWPSWFEARPTLRADAKAGDPRRSVPGVGRGGVMAVHSERLVRGEGDRAALEMTDAWVDPRTLGARLIGASTLPLVRVATAVAGIEVFAARGGDGVEFVVTGARIEGNLDPQAKVFARQLARLNVRVAEGSGGSDCAHLRVALHPNAEAGPQMGVVQTVALLPPLRDAAAEDKVNGNARVDALRLVQGLRKRALHIGLSATQTSADDEPVVSVAIGWAGREARR